uniref:Peptidase A2 domain-containing protein n=1 Tax=Oryzias latipes TaxID=8090 RepID=A0A3P9JQI5_ORYLA
MVNEINSSEVLIQKLSQNPKQMLKKKENNPTICFSPALVRPLQILHWCQKWDHHNVRASKHETASRRSLLSTPRPFFLPETFSGSEIAAEVNYWEDALKVKFMSILLSGLAREGYSGLSPSAKAKLSIIKRGNESVFGPLRQWGLEQSQFSNHATQMRLSGILALPFDSLLLKLFPPNHVGKATTKMDGGQLVVLGSWQTVCQLATLTLPIEFLVSELTSDEILLGFDFLAKHNVIVDLEKNVCQIRGKCFPLVNSNLSLAAKVVVIQSDATVPPRSEGSHYGLP